MRWVIQVGKLQTIDSSTTPCCNLEVISKTNGDAFQNVTNKSKEHNPVRRAKLAHEKMTGVKPVAISFEECDGEL